MYLAQNLKCMREEKGLTQRDMAQELGISASLIGMWEQERRKIDVEMVVRLARYFSVTLDDLILNDLKPPIPHYVSNIKFLRKKHNMTQEDMAKLLGFKGKQGYNAIENGKVKPNIENLEKVADYFNVTLDELVKQDLSEGGS